MADNPTASGGFEIRITGLAEFIEHVEKLEPIIENLDGTLRKADKAFDAFEQKLARISKISSVATTNFKNLFNSFDVDLKNFTKFNTEDFSGLTKFADAIVDSINRLSVIGREDLFRNLSQFLNSFTGFFNSFFDLSKNIGKELNGNFESGFKDALLFVTDLSKELEKIVPSIASALSSFDKIADTQVIRNSAEAITAISKIIQTFRSFQDTAKEADLESTGFKDFVKEFEGFDAIVRVLVKSLQRFESIPDVRGLREIGETFAGLGSFFKTLPNIITILEQSVTATGAKRFILFGKRALEVTGALRNLPLIFRELSKAINEFDSIKVSPEKLNSVSQSLSALGNFLPRFIQSVASITDEVSTIKTVETGSGGGVLGGIFRGIFGSGSDERISQVSKFAADVNSKIIPAISIFIKGVGKVIRDIPDVDEFRKFSVGIDNLAKALERLEKLSTGNLGQIGNDLQRDLPRIFDVITKSAKGSFARSNFEIALSFATGFAKALSTAFTRLVIPAAKLAFQGLIITFKFLAKQIKSLFTGDDSFINVIVSALTVGLNKIKNILGGQNFDFNILEKGTTIELENLDQKLKELTRTILLFKTSASDAFTFRGVSVDRFNSELDETNTELKQVSVSAEKTAISIKELTKPQLGGVFPTISKSADVARVSFEKLEKIKLDGLEDELLGLRKTAKTLDFDFLVGEFKQIRQSIADGFSFRDLGTQLATSGKNIANAFINSVKQTLGIASPSRVMASIARLTAAGFSDTILGFTTLFGGLGETLADAFTTAFEKPFKFLIENTLGRLDDAIRFFTTQASRRLRETGRDLLNFGRDISRLGTQLIATGGLFSLLQGKQLNEFANFDALISQIQVFGGATVSEIKLIEESILDLGTSSAFVPVEIAAGFLELQKAGLSLADSQLALKDVLDLATAGQLELGSTAELVIQIMNGFGLEVEDTTQIVNTLTGAADISVSSIESVGQALSFVAPLASAAGFSLEDVSAAIAFLADRGIDGARAGTSLRSVFSSLINPTNEARKFLDLYNIGLTDAEGNTKSFEDVMSQFIPVLEEFRTKGLSDVQIIEELSALGDQRAIAGFLNLIETTDDGTLAFAEYRQALNDALSAEEAAAAIGESLRGTFNQITSAAQALTFKALRPLVDFALQPLLKAVAELLKFLGNLPDEFLAISAAIGALVAIITTLSGVFLFLSGILLQQIGVGIIAASFAFSGLIFIITNPVGLIAAVVALGGGLLVLAGIFAAFATLAAVAFTAVIAVINDFRNNAEEIRESGERLSQAFAGLSKATAPLINSFLQLIATVIGVSDVFNGAEGSESIIVGVIDKITEKVKGLTKTFQELQLFFNFLQLQIQEPEVNIPLIDEKDTKALLERRDELVAINDELKKLQSQRDLQLSLGIDTTDVDTKISEITDSIEGFGQSTETITIKSGDTLSQLAIDLGTTVDDLLKLNPQIEDPNLIFAGEELIVDVTGNFTDLETEIADINDELLDFPIDTKLSQIERNKLLAEADRNSRLVRNIIESRFAETDLFKFLFGEGDDAIDKAVDFAITLVDTFNQVKESFLGITEGVRQIFSGDVRAGFRNIELAISQVILQFDKLFSNLFGDGFLADNVADKLSEGNLSGALFTAFKNIFSNFVGLLIDNRSIFSDAIAFIVEQIFNNSFANLPIILGQILGIDAIKEIGRLLAEVGNVLGTGIGSVVENAIGVLGGDIDFETALTNIANDLSNALKENPELSNAIKELEEIFDFVGITENATKIAEELEKAFGSQEFKDLVTNVGNLAIELGKLIGILAVGVLAIAFEGLVPVTRELIPLFDGLNRIIVPLTKNLSEINTELIKASDNDDFKTGILALAAAFVVLGFAAGFAAIAISPFLLPLLLIAGFVLLLADNAPEVSKLIEELGGLINSLIDLGGGSGNLADVFESLEDFIIAAGELSTDVGASFLSFIREVLLLLGVSKTDLTFLDKIIIFLDNIDSEVLRSNLSGFKDLLNDFVDLFEEFSLRLQIAVLSASIKLAPIIADFINAFYSPFDALRGLSQEALDFIGIDFEIPDVEFVVDSTEPDLKLKELKKQLEELPFKEILEDTLEEGLTGDLNFDALLSRLSEDADLASFFRENLFNLSEADKFQLARDLNVTKAEVDALIGEILDFSESPEQLESLTTDLPNFLSNALFGLDFFQLDPETFADLIPEGLGQFFLDQINASLTDEDASLSETDLDFIGLFLENISAEGIEIPRETLTLFEELGGQIPESFIDGANEADLEQFTRQVGAGAAEGFSGGFEESLTEGDIEFFQDLKVQENVDKFRQFGRDIGTGANEGLAESEDSARQSSIQLFETYRNAFQTIAGIFSPSTVFQEFGRNIVNGLVLGITENLPLFDFSLTLIEQRLNSTNELVNIFALLVQDSFERAANSMVSASAIMQNSLASIEGQLISLVANLDATINTVNLLNASLAGVGGFSVPSVLPFGGGRADGGLVSKNTVFQVNERNQPELLTTASGKQFLIPNENGFITPISNTSSITNNRNTTEVSFGDIHLNIPPEVTNVSPDVVRNALDSWVRDNPPQIRNRNFN